MFELFNTSGNDDKLTKHEMKLFLEKLGMYPSEAELEEMFNMFDSNNSGMIDFPEFLSLMTKEFERDPLAQ